MAEDKNQQGKKAEPIKLQIGTRIAEEKTITYQLKSTTSPAEFKANKKKT